MERREHRLTEREERLDEQHRTIEERQTELTAHLAELNRRKAEIRDLEDERRRILEGVANLTTEQARSELVAAIETEAKRHAHTIVRDIERQALDEGETKAHKIITGAVQRLASEQTSESVVSVVHLPSDDMKGRIIGREGRNIRSFEQTTGVNLIIDDTPEAVLLSCFDPVRRETCAADPGFAGTGRPDPRADRGDLRTQQGRGRRACVSAPPRTRWPRSGSPTCTRSWPGRWGCCGTGRRTGRTC